ncbi:MAG: CAP domain-containing protein [Bacteroidota bacterium]|nr:CAP domain-containing protein [Bacteroidota bacterium]
MNKKFIILTVLFALIVTIIALPSVVDKYRSNTLKPQKVDCSFNSLTLLDKINSVRSHKLTFDEGLMEIAQKRAVSLPPELDHHAGFRQLISDKAFDYKFHYLSEILASNPCASTDNMFTQWKNSPSHWSAITNERFDVLGIGYNSQGAVVIFGDLDTP